jgi:hypothetical protein
VEEGSGAEGLVEEDSAAQASAQCSAEGASDAACSKPRCPAATHAHQDACSPAAAAMAAAVMAAAAAEA